MAQVSGGKVTWDLDVIDTKFKQGMASARSEAESTAKSVQGSMSGISRAFDSATAGSFAFAKGLAAIGTAGLAAAGFGVKIAGDLESARQGFVALLGSATEADAVMARVKKEAASTPFEIQGLVTGTQALAAITKDGNKAIDILLDVGKAVAVSGKGQAELDRVVFNLQQISATGKVTAMDIRQFQSAIPIFNDIVEASGITVKSLMEADNSAELLFEAFAKAGKGSGIAAQGFAAQAGTWNQLWSNLMDTIKIGASDFVKQLGIFDLAKKAIKGLTDVLATLTAPASIDKIQAFFKFLADYSPIIAGAIIGGLVPAAFALASGFAALMLPLIPFIAIGIAVGAVILLLKALFENLPAVFTAVQTALDPMVQAFLKMKTNIQLFLTELGLQIFEIFNNIKLTLLNFVFSVMAFVQAVALPFQWLYYNVVEPIMLLIQAVIQRVFFEIFAFLQPIVTSITNFITTQWNIIYANVSARLTAIMGFVSSVWSSISAFTSSTWTTIKNTIGTHITDALDKVTTTGNSIKSVLVNIWNGIVSFFKGIAGAIVNAIVEPFEAAKRKVEQIANAIREAAANISPFTRHSPSLVDQVKSGIDIIKKEYASLGSLSFAPVSNPMAVSGISNSHSNDSATTGGREIVVNMNTVNVRDDQDVQAIGREFGFRLSVSPGIK